MFLLCSLVVKEKRSGRELGVESQLKTSMLWDVHGPHLHGPSRAKLAVKSFFLLTDDPWVMEGRGHRVSRAWGGGWGGGRTVVLIEA